jgi:dTDP-4-amino-4,6-dideoxygalactose transaminase
MADASAAGRPLSVRQAHHRTRLLLRAFCEDKHWLAALAEEGEVFDAPDPEDEQLLRALDRFKGGEIALITRDESLLSEYVGVAHCITCASGTDALLMALMALDIGVAEKVAAECLSLPISPYMTEVEQEKIVQAIDN